VPFNNPLQLVQIRSGLEAAFGMYPGGTQLLHVLMNNVHDALVDGLHAIFLVGAILMTVATIVNLFLREVPLRKRVAGAVMAEQAQPPQAQPPQAQASMD
jgi:heme exporter protein D